MRKRRFLLVVCVLVFAALIALPALSACNRSAGLSAEQFDEYLDELLYYMLKDDAMSVAFILSDPSAYGLDQTGASLPRPILNQSDYYAAYAAYENLAADLLRFNFSALSQKQKDIWQIFMYEFAETAKKKDFFYFQSGYLGASSGVNSNLPVELSMYRFNSTRDIENYLSVLMQAKDVFKAYCDYEKIRVDNGFGRSDKIYQGIIDQCMSFAPVNPQSPNFLIADFDNKIDACDFLSAQQKSDYKTQNLDYMNNYFLAAYRQTAATVATFLNKPDNNSLGLYHYKGGAAYYQWLFNSKTSTDDSIQTALSNLSGFYNAVLSGFITQRDGYIAQYGAQSLTADFAALSENQDFSFNALTALLNDLQTLVAADFPQLPETIPAPTLFYVDESLADFYSPAAYFISTVDSLTSPEVIYVNTFSENSYNTFELLSHEGYPGHLLQNAYFKSTGIHPVRRIFGFSGYAEGWGTYAQFYTAKYFSGAERLKKAYNLFMTQRLLSGLRMSLVDLVVNGLGYDVAQTAQFIQSTGVVMSGEELNAYAQNLIDFVVENPVNSAVYYYGYYKLITLRDRFKSLYGANYTDLAFHTAVLSAGPMKFTQLEKKLFG